MITVDDIRRAIQDLPGNSPVLISPMERELWGFNDRSLCKAIGGHDGRFGCVLYLKLDGYVAPYNSKEIKQTLLQRLKDCAHNSLK